jgi:hypothetical protein
VTDALRGGEFVQGLDTGIDRLASTLPICKVILYLHLRNTEK